MNCVLQMTFIPNIEEQAKFFIWMTDPDEKPLFPHDSFLLEEVLSLSEWEPYFLDESQGPKTIALESEDEFIQTQGLLISMPAMFHLLQHDLLSSRGEAYFQFGQSFDYWTKIAKSIAILLKHGHYYPTLYLVEKNHHHYAYAQWMLSRKLLHGSDLFNNWLRSVPAIVLSADPLYDLPIRQWLSVLLDTWVDQLIREMIRPAFSTGINKLPHSQWFDRYSLKWFYYLHEQGFDYFSVIQDGQTLTEVQELIKEIQQWHHSLLDHRAVSPTETLVQFKQEHMRNFIDPQAILISAEPVDHDEPFAAWSEWRLSLQVEGEQNDAQEVFEAEVIWNHLPSSREWLKGKIGELKKLHSFFSPMKYHKNKGVFRFYVSTNELTQFYSRHFQELAEAGIELRFPAWLEWQNWSDQEVDLYLDTFAPEEGTLSLRSIVNFEWRISIGEISLPVTEFRRLVDKGERIVKHQGEWVELPLEKMKAAYDEMTQLNQHLGKQGQITDVLHLSISQQRRKRENLHLSFPKQVENYLQKILEKPTKLTPPPQSFKGELRPYQQDGFTWLTDLRNKGVGACLADDMGLGKTIQTIAYLLQYQQELRAKKEPAALEKIHPALIICPTSLIGNWQRELQLFAPDLSVYAHHGSQRYDPLQFEEHKYSYDVVLTSYQLAVRDDKVFQQNWPILILDEAQAIKNPATKQSQAIRKMEADHRIVLTGTPLENRLEELWSIMDFINPGYLGSLNQFRQLFITPITKRNDQEKSELLKRLIQPFLLRRMKTDPTIIPDLPDKSEKKVICSLTQYQAYLYQSIVEELMRKVAGTAGIGRKGLILAALTKLKQICNHPRLIFKHDTNSYDSGKLNQFKALLDSILREDQSVLVFTQYVGMGHLLQAQIGDHFKETPVFFLHGALPSTKREELIEQFRQYKGSKAVFILSLKAGGLGLNLTEANHVIHYDRWWNPAVEDQATDRTYRIGQEKNVHVYKLICEGTLEEKIDELIDKKRSLTEQILGQSDGWVTELSDEEVFELIRLRGKVMS